MAKLLTRLVLVILLGLVAYLYVQVIDLQRENRQLAAQVGSLGSIEQENRSLKAEMAKGSRPQQTETGQVDLISDARYHVLNAERAVGKGDFVLAVKETREANASLTLAGDNASAESRQTVQSLRSQLDQVRSKAKSIWNQFGG